MTNNNKGAPRHGYDSIGGNCTWRNQLHACGGGLELQAHPRDHVKFLKNGSKVVLQPDWKRRDMNAVTSSVQCPVPGGPWIHGFRPYYQGEIIWPGAASVGFRGSLASGRMRGIQGDNDLNLATDALRSLGNADPSTRTLQKTQHHLVICDIMS